MSGNPLGLVTGPASASRRNCLPLIPPEFPDRLVHDDDVLDRSFAPPPTPPPGPPSRTAPKREFLAFDPAVITNAGGLSPFGTMAQSGNAWEWIESGSTAPNDSAGEDRPVRGGNWVVRSGSLQSSFRTTGYSPAAEHTSFGFRVASVPDPSAVLLSLVAGGLGLARRRRKG